MRAFERCRNRRRRELRASDARGEGVSDNFYWLSTKPDTLDWAKKQDTVYTPQAEFADLTGLNSLPAVQLESSAVIEQPPWARELLASLGASEAEPDAAPDPGRFGAV